MYKLLIFLSIVRLSHGFLLDSSNTSLPVKPTYLTITQYYGDKAQFHDEIAAVRSQQEAYRHEQDNALKVLADQLQQRLLAMEQKMTNDKNASTHQSANLSEQKYKELEQKYTSLDRKYQELVQNFMKHDQTLGILQNQNQVCLDNNTKLQNEIKNLKATDDRMRNKTDEIQQELKQLKHLKNVNQLQTLSNLSDKVNTFDSRISLLSGHEQSRNQDFLALYNLTTSTSSRLKLLESGYNRSLSSLQLEERQARYNFIKMLDMLANDTSSKIDSLNQSQNLSSTRLQISIEENNKKVVLVGCMGSNGINFNSGSPYKFPKIITKGGLPRVTDFNSTGRFICPAKGIYHISAVLKARAANAYIDIMKNSVSVHHQLLTGSGNSYWKPGTAIIALELNVNDTVWIKAGTSTNLYSSCLTIFKL